LGPTVPCVPPCPQSGYPCLSLHGGKDQSDRESTISDFKSNVCNVLVATSVAARGLDVKDLVRRVCMSISMPNTGRCLAAACFILGPSCLMRLGEQSLALECNTTMHAATLRSSTSVLVSSHAVRWD
jgi:Helicase conserved C-terminal domain